MLQFDITLPEVVAHLDGHNIINKRAIPQSEITSKSARTAWTELQKMYEVVRDIKPNFEGSHGHFEVWERFAKMIIAALPVKISDAEMLNDEQMYEVALTIYYLFIIRAALSRNTTLSRISAKEFKFQDALLCIWSAINSNEHESFVYYYNLAIDILNDRANAQEA